MAYVPHSRMNFAGDIHHDVRDFLLDRRDDTLALMTGEIADIYLRATSVLLRGDDAVADCLRNDPLFDVRTLQVAHDYLAAYWRRHLLRIDTRWIAPWFEETWGNWHQSYGDCLWAFRGWLAAEIGRWSRDRPDIIRTVCLILVLQNVPRGYAAQIDLFDMLCGLYPMALDRP